MKGHFLFSLVTHLLRASICLQIPKRAFTSNLQHIIMWESDCNLGFPHKTSFKIYYISWEIHVFLASVKDAVTGLMWVWVSKEYHLDSSWWPRWVNSVQKGEISTSPFPKGFLQQWDEPQSRGRMRKASGWSHESGICGSAEGVVRVYGQAEASQGVSKHSAFFLSTAVFHFLTDGASFLLPRVSTYDG